MNRFVRRIVTGAAMIATVVVGVGLQATPADAQPRSIVITDDVNIRPNPNTSQAPLKLMPKGSHPTYICYADGENRGGTTKWFKISWGGVQGYYSSIADDVPLAAQSNIEGNYGIPRCNTGADINQGSGKDATVTPAPTIFNRAATASWGLENAQNLRLFNRFPDCTWFVSQALWYGGFRQTPDWNMTDWHGFPLWPIQGTASATAAPELVKYLKANTSVTVIPLTPDRFRNNRVPEAKPGDVIAYKWTTPANWNYTSATDFDHLALVTNIAPGSYPEVSEWGTGWPTVSYKKRGWTWSVNGDKWLQDEYKNKVTDEPEVTAILLHFNY